MPTPASRAHAIAECLTAAGFSPTVQEYEDHIRVEAKAPDGTSEESWMAVLRALTSVDRLGQEEDESGDKTVWAVVFKETPATAPTARGHGRQL
jgi:hypothetical protein